MLPPWTSPPLAVVMSDGATRLLALVRGLVALGVNVALLVRLDSARAGAGLRLG